MITSIIFLIVLGCFAWINTSKKAVLPTNTVVEQWLQSNTKFSKIIGSLVSTIALWLSMRYFGTTLGLLFWLIALMTLLSLVIILNPIKLLNYNYLMMAFAVSFTVELLLNYAS